MSQLAVRSRRRVVVGTLTHAVAVAASLGLIGATTAVASPTATPEASSTASPEASPAASPTASPETGGAPRSGDAPPAVELPDERGPILAEWSLQRPLGAAQRARATSTRPAFQMPFACGQRWNAFTYRGHEFNDYALDLNQGVGYADDGLPIVASEGGTARVRTASNGGRSVDIDHGGGWSTNYLHLKSFAIADGARVSRGDLIGYVGDSGRATASHLHYAQRFNGTAQHVVWDGSPVTYSYTANGPLFTSRNCAAPTPAPAPQDAGHQDLDGDGLDDLIGLSVGRQLRWAPALGDGTFGARRVVRSLPGDVTEIAVGDLTGNDRVDVVALRSNGEVLRLLGDGRGGFGAPQRVATGWSGIRAIAVGDVTGNGRADLVGVNGAGELVRAVRRSASEYWRPVVFRTGWGGMRDVVVADVFGDSREEVVGLGGNGLVYTSSSTGPSAYTAKAVWVRGWGAMRDLAVLDVNGNGRKDLIGLGADHQLRRQLAKSDREFYGMTGSGGMGGGFHQVHGIE